MEKALSGEFGTDVRTIQINTNTKPQIVMTEHRVFLTPEVSRHLSTFPPPKVAVIPDCSHLVTSVECGSNIIPHPL